MNYDDRSPDSDRTLLSGCLNTAHRGRGPAVLEHRDELIARTELAAVAHGVARAERHAVAAAQHQLRVERGYALAEQLQTVVVPG